MNHRIRRFFFPPLAPRFLIRASLVALVTYFFFGFVCTPIFIKGYSMEPTYHDGAVNFCLKLHYLFADVKRFDVVAVRFAGERVMLLKRIVALEGEQMEFRGGKLFVNFRAIEEPYVRYPCDWNLPPRKVEAGHVYVIGDNRNMPMEEHALGQTAVDRVAGVPLW